MLLGFTLNSDKKWLLLAKISSQYGISCNHLGGEENERERERERERFIRKFKQGIASFQSPNAVSSTPQFHHKLITV